MRAQEIPLVFDCEGQSLIGIVHLPEHAKKIGVLSIVAGGPQYRAGCCRQLIQMARALAEDGTPVMRFDYRGLGDGAGEYKGFQYMKPDLDAAIDAFVRAVPTLQGVVLWGGCDAASAALLHGPSNRRVTGLILANPWVHTEQTHAKVVVRHYYWKRIREKSFWLKILTLKLNVLGTLKSVVSTYLLSQQSGKSSKAGEQGEQLPYPQRMCMNASTFKGRILLMMSGLSLVSKEFDELVASNTEWYKAINRDGVSRIDFPEADQAFSTSSARTQQISAAINWLKDFSKDNC